MTTHQKFKDTLLSFLDELIQTYPHIGDFTLAKMFVSGCDPEYIVSKFRRRILPFKAKIKNRDENYFLGSEFDLLDKMIDKSKVGYFRQIWSSPSMGHDDKQVIWDWFDVLIFLCEACDS